MNKIVLFLLMLIPYFSGLKCAMPPLPDETNYFTLLGVAQNASQKDIENAYKALAKQWHPDNFQEDQKQQAQKVMQKINDAKVLTNKHFRKAYQLYLPFKGLQYAWVVNGYKDCSTHEKIVALASADQVQQEEAEKEAAEAAPLDEIKSRINVHLAKPHLSDDEYKSLVNDLLDGLDRVGKTPTSNAEKRLYATIEKFFIDKIGVTKKLYLDWYEYNFIKQIEVEKFFETLMNIKSAHSVAELGGWLESLENPKPGNFKTMLNNLSLRYLQYKIELLLNKNNLDESESQELASLVCDTINCLYKFGTLFLKIDPLEKIIARYFTEKIKVEKSKFLNYKFDSLDAEQSRYFLSAFHTKNNLTDKSDFDQWKKNNPIQINYIDRIDILGLLTSFEDYYQDIKFKEKLDRIQELSKAHLEKSEVEKVVEIICWALESVLPKEEPLVNSFEKNLQQAVLDFFAKHLAVKIANSIDFSAVDQEKNVQFITILANFKKIENMNKLKSWIAEKNEIIGNILIGLYGLYDNFINSFKSEKELMDALTQHFEIVKKNPLSTQKFYGYTGEQAAEKLLWASFDPSKPKALRQAWGSCINSYFSKLCDTDIRGNTLTDLNVALRRSPHAHALKFKEAISRFDKKINDQISTLLGIYDDPVANQRIVYAVCQLVSNFPINSSDYTNSEKDLAQNIEQYFIQKVGVTKIGDSYSYEKLGGNDAQAPAYKSAEATAFREQMVTFFHGIFWLNKIAPTQGFDAWCDQRFPVGASSISKIVRGLYYEVYLPMRLRSMSGILTLDGKKFDKPYTLTAYPVTSLLKEPFNAVQAFGELMYQAKNSQADESKRSAWKKSADDYFEKVKSADSSINDLTQLKKDLETIAVTFGEKDELSNKLSDLRDSLVALKDKLKKLKDQLSLLKVQLGS